MTWQIDWVEPRSTSSHCGSENALDQRVPRLPSVALTAGNEPFSWEDAVVGRCSATFVVPQLAARAAGPLTIASVRHAAARMNDATILIAFAPDHRRRWVSMRGLMGVLSRRPETQAGTVVLVVGAGSAATAGPAQPRTWRHHQCILDFVLF